MKIKNRYPKQFWWCIGTFGLICMVIFGLPTLFTQLPSVLDFTGTGEIGDTIGGIMGPFVAIGAAFLTFMAFWVQKEANDAQRQDMKVERFNATFFNLLSIHEQITDSLECKTTILYGFNDKSEIVKGRAVFQYTYDIRPEREKQGVISGIKGRIAAYDMAGYMNSEVPTYFDHYFRNMYRIVKYVHEADVFDYLPDKERWEKKYEYVAILRSTLSRYELTWLFYNGLSDYGKDRFKPLIEEYALLNNIRKELLVKPTDVDEYGTSAFQKKKFE